MNTSSMDDEVRRWGGVSRLIPEVEECGSGENSTSYHGAG